MTSPAKFLPDQVAFITFALNHFGTGGHPMADAATLEFFNDSYIRECVQRAVNSDKLSSSAKLIATNYLEANV